MNFDRIVGIMLYFGSFLIPIAYCCFTRLRGRATRLMLIGALFQLIASLLVYAFVEYSRRNGYQDYWMAWGLLPWINFVGCFYYCVVMLQMTRKK